MIDKGLSDINNWLSTPIIKKYNGSNSVSVRRNVISGQFSFMYGVELSFYSC